MKSLILLAAALALIASGCAPATDTTADDATNTTNGTESAEGSVDKSGAPDPTPVGAEDEKAEGEPKSADTTAAGAPLGFSEMKIAVHTNDKGELVCPVMKSVIESENRAVGFKDYEGKRYYFCCDGCPEVFEKDPVKWSAN
jgi:YHS domain-containing protein